LAWRGAGAVAGQATGLIAGALGRQPGHGQDREGVGTTAPREPAAPLDTAAAPPEAPAAPPVSAEPEAPAFAEAPVPPEPEPIHVSEDPVLVAEVAESGAEDGAGAQVTIDEPWDGYRLMNAGAVIDRLGAASPAELATVELYELAHRNRRTVLQAAQRELKLQS